MAGRVPGFQTADEIAARFNLDIQTVSRTIDFLLGCEILVESEGSLKIGKGQIHLGAESPWISKHHINWRIQSMRSMSVRRPTDLHYSSAMSLSQKDCERLKEMMISLINEKKAVVKESKEEVLFCMALDFFEI